MRSLQFLAAAVILGASTAMAQMPVIRGEPSLTPKEAMPVARLRLAPSPSAPSVRLPQVAASELQSIRRANRSAKRLLIGIARPLERAGKLPTARDLAWTPVSGGYAAQLAVSSPQAGALRVAIALANVPADVEITVFGSDAPARLVGPVKVGSFPDRTRAWWSPITDGETQTVEFYVPAKYNPNSVQFKVTSLSHVFTTIASGLKKRTQEIGEAGSCNIDIKCSDLLGSQAFLNARNSVAQMVFNDGSFTGLCTGELLNDSDPYRQTPWFFGANHCFDNENLPLKSAAEMQQVANTLNTLWSFEAVACHSLTVPTYTQLTNGATFIYNNAAADALFLRLNDMAPPGAFFSGWDANTISPGQQVITIHHPQGDLKKVSEGSVTRFSMPPVTGGGAYQFIEVRWAQGTTEGGSSGGGLWTDDGFQYNLRGALWGGSALCTNPTGTDNFSRFDQIYPALAQYLNPSVTPAFDFSDMWWNPNESGWGLNVIQHASGNIFAVWFTYEPDGSRTWFVMPSGSWSSPTTWSGTLYATSGPSTTMPFNPAAVQANIVGSGTLSFSDANNGSWSYNVNGISGSKPITRQSF